MSEVHLDPVEVRTPAVLSNVSAKARKLPPLDIGIIPLRLVAYDIDSYRLRRGWPKEVPKFDVRARGLISLQGYRMAERLDPYALDTNADVRWIAHPDYYDQADLIWRPHQDSYGFQWITSPDYAPVLEEEYTYRAGNQLLTQMCLNFDPANRDHFWSNFGSMSLPGFTWAFVASLRSPEGTMGLLAPGGPTPVADEFEESSSSKTISLKMIGHTLSVNVNNYRELGVAKIDDWLSKQSPLFIFFVVQPPAGQLYVAQGSRTQRLYDFKVGETGSFDLNYVLGRTTGSVYETADMALFELGFYADALSKADVAHEVATLSSIYGGSNTS